LDCVKGEIFLERCVSDQLDECG